MVDIPIGEWLPDLYSLASPGAERVLNVLALTAQTYGPINTLAETGNALGSACMGASSYRGAAGGVLNTAGTASKLYMGDSSSTWTDVSKVGGYNVAVNDKWQFTQFGDIVVAVNGTDNPQYWTIGTSTAWADLAGSPPIARFTATVRDFVFLARLAAAGNRLQWSSINNAAEWTAGLNQGDDQDLPAGGRIMGIVGGEIGVVLSESAINRFTYVGSPAIFQRDTISLEHGTPCENSVVGYQGIVFFVSWDGFWALQDGSVLTPIGDQKVDLTFWNDPEIGVNTAYLYNVIGAYDPIKKLYIVGYPSIQSTDGTVDSVLIFNRTLGRWSFAAFSFEWLYAATTSQGYNIDNIDTVYGNLDAIPISLDSPLLTGSGKMLPAAFTTNHKFATFGGTTMAALIDTTEGQIAAGRRALVTEIRPIIDGGTGITAAVGYRNLPNEALSWATAQTQNANGFCPARTDARYHRARIQVPAAQTWSNIAGIDITAHQSGAY